MELKSLYTKTRLFFLEEVLPIEKRKNNRLIQSATLFSSMILAMGLNFIGSIITARMLGPVSYGDVKFIQTVWSLLTLISSFGYFHSGSRILVLESDIEKIREICGAILVIAFSIGIIVGGITAAIANPLDQLMKSNTSEAMILLAPFVVALPVFAAMTLILQGTNRIFMLSILNSLPILAYLISVFVLSRLNILSTSTVLLAHQVPLMLTLIVMAIIIKPSFKSMRIHWENLRIHNKTYGGPVYRGSLANVASSYINRLAISYWVDNTAVGFYSLANSLTEPLKFIPNAVATSSFRSFANQKQVSRKAFISTLGLTIFSLIAAFIFFGKPLSWVYTENFAPVGMMSRAMALGAIFIGFGDFYNRFLGAHGKGAALRNVAYLVGAVNIGGFFLLVPSFGTWGAIITSIFGGITYFLFMYRYYLKYLQNPENESSSAKDQSD